MESELFAENEPKFQRCTDVCRQYGYSSDDTVYTDEKRHTVQIRHTGNGDRSGEIKQVAPYARFQYYGNVMVSRITGSAWARNGESKVITNNPLQYDTSRHPLAGKMWFERMKADKKDAILQGARRFLNR